ncbi:hypothetical protein BKP35_05490 [Anaerobacillus arseniciselenatis]|uniref:CHAT domain-containing protein n=1 Tax=Anaerobacillus arseniciselenatis TaxID=85682 RepID=A0A1S2LQV5_9BACI|nr:hypothetical protein [Anaerobacillus arseniciselenatis]OIJ14888.1 hypothetical protein BKP35_05490 [Anaerobacillus arseniciselenatis]
MSNDSEIPILCEERFTICLTDFIGEQIVTEKVIVELLNKNITGTINIAVLKYSVSKFADLLKNIAARNIGVAENIHRIKLYQPTKLNSKVIVDEANLNLEEDMVLIYGAERLSEFSLMPNVEKEYGQIKINLYSSDQVDIETGISQLAEINDLLDHRVSNFVSIFETGLNIARKVFEKYEDDKGMEINVMFRVQEEPNNINISECIKKIENMKVKEAITFIDQQDKLLKEDKDLLRFITYLNNGYKEECLKVLQSNYGSLNNSMKLIYAELLNSGEQYCVSYQILKELYHEDKWLVGLPKALIISSRYLNANERESLIEEILELGLIDIFLLQECANFYNKIKDYKKSGELFRKLFSVTNDKYFELLARTSELQSNPPSKGHDAEGYLLAVSIDEPELQNEVFYRCALIWKFIYNSAYKFAEYMFKIKLSYNFDHSNEVINQKMEILGDLYNVEKGLKLKPLDKERDNDILISKRIDLVIDELEYLFIEDNGHNLLRGFIDDTQSKGSWEKGLVKKLRQQIFDWNNVDLAGINDSFDRYTESDLSELNSKNAIRLIRKYKTKKTHAKKDIEETINGSIILANQEGGKLNELWLRFEAATWYSYLGYYQDANNIALTLLNYSNRITDDYVLRDYSFALGIAAWGDSQYRLGREVEGVICAIVAIKKGIILKDYYLIDKGLTIIQLWISNNSIFGSEDRDKFQNFQEKFTGTIEGTDNKLVKIQGFILKKEWEKAYELLKQYIIVFENEEDEEWAIHFSNYISVCIESGKKDEALELLYNKALKAAQLLEVRMDIRWKSLLMWSQILFAERNSHYNLLDILLINKDLLKIAVEDVEKQRVSMFHREERANLSDQTNSLLRTYVETLSILHKLRETPEELKSSLEQEVILNLIKVAPRTIAEKKLYNGEVSEETEKKFNQYLTLYDELMRIEADIESHEYQEKTQKFDLLQQELLLSHPYLKALPVIEVNDISKIQDKLLDNEICYQYCLTPMGMVYLLITKNEKEFGHIFLDSKKIKQIANQLGETFSSSFDIKNISQVEELCSNLSEPIFYPLLNQKYVEKIENLFICPDMSIPYFSTSLIRTKTEWFLHSVDGIYNLLSVANLLERTTISVEAEENCNILTIGSRLPKGDGAIPIAERWAKENKTYFKEIINDFGKSNKIVIDTLKIEKPTLYTMIAHGVEEPDVSSENGAFLILGPNKQYLSIRDIEDISTYSDNMFLITCRSGQPYTDNMQSSNSVWTNMLSQKNNSILCRWDVDIRPSIIILEHLVSNDDKPICHLLCEAQKKLIQSEEWKMPSAWAGFEYWGI